MNSNRNFSFSKRLIKFNNRKANKSSIKKSKNQFDELKASLSFNSFNIYNQNLNNYSIENTLNDLLIKRMTDFSFISGSSSKNKQSKKQRKINLINVNNYFNPQINIIKVNKLNEKKIVDSKSKEKRKDKDGIRQKKNEYNIIQSYDNFKFIRPKEKNFVSKIKLIQSWWKGIYNIIKIQKNIRGYLFRNKLLENLEQEKILICNIFLLYKAIRKIVINIIFEKLKKFIHNRNNSSKKENLIKKKLLKGTIKEKDITNITYINNYNTNFINNFKLDKEKINIKDIFTINDNSNNYQNKKIGSNYTKDYSIQPKFFNKSKDWKNYKIIKNISFINNINTNNISNINNNYFYNKYNRKYIQKKENINDQMFPRIKKSLKNKYSLSKNKSIFENSFNNLTNITISTNKTKKEYIDYFKNKYNKKQTKNKISVKPRNFIDTNKSSISSNYFKNKSIIPNKNSNKKINNIINSYRTGITKEVKFNKIKNKNFNFISNSNNNRNEKMISNNKLNMNNTLKKEKNYIIRYYFSSWKEITEKKIILQQLKNHIEVSLTLKSNMFKTVRKKLYISKVTKLKKSLFRKGLGLLIKKILNKCILYKYFMLFSQKVNRIKILRKLKNFLKLRSKYNNTENDFNLRSKGRKEQNKISPKRIRCKRKISIEKINKNNNKLFLSTSLISFNTMRLFSNLYNKKKGINKNLNYSNQNLKINPKININKSINNNSKIENHKNKSNNNKNNNKKNDIKNPNLIMQINQLKMIFNLLELHNSKKKSFIYYFTKWKKNINEIKKNEKTPKSKMKDNRTNNMMERNLTTKYRIMKYFSPYKKEYRDYSYKNKDKSLYSRDSKDKSRIDFTNDSKNNLNNTNYNFSNFKNNNEPINISINMIYKKKLIFDGNRTSRNNISDYSALLECKNVINKHNNDNKNYDKNNNKNICNLFNQTLDNTSFGERFYKRINKIEEREIFFNKEIKKDTQYDKKTYKNKNYGNNNIL